MHDGRLNHLRRQCDWRRSSRHWGCPSSWSSWSLRSLRLGDIAVGLRFNLCELDLVATLCGFSDRPADRAAHHQHPTAYRNKYRLAATGNCEEGAFRFCLLLSCRLQNGWRLHRFYNNYHIRRRRRQRFRKQLRVASLAPWPSKVFRQLVAWQQLAVRSEILKLRHVKRTNDFLAAPNVVARHCRLS